MPSSMREKKRYIEFELFCDKPLKEKDVSFYLWKQMLFTFGELGTAKQRLWLAGFNSETNTGILRCTLSTVEEVKAGMLFLREVRNKTVVPKILKVSGTIKSLK
ncbi:MAG: Rpp14/Pop5 family protein [Candidatus Diapherotrites archaeon]|nr:Rpp14/Pop5 family protein [Candidatus Diapherotrites archaeon]